MSEQPHTILVGYAPLDMVVDRDRIESIAPGAEVLSANYDLPHEEHTRRAHDPKAPDLAEIELSTELLDALQRADIMLTFNAPLDLRQYAPRLQWIQAMGSGVGQYEPSLRPDFDITLTNAAGIASAPIAEWVLARILEIYKRLPLHAEQQRQHLWKDAFGKRLEGSTALIVGLGAIGIDVAKRLRAFGVTVIGVKRSWQPGMTSPDADELIGPDAMLDTLGRADIVVVAAPGTAANESLFDAKAFAAMKPRSVFVNVARGLLVDEAALIDALESKHLLAAATDVARHEPLPADSPLWDTRNLAISPHSSASADQYLERVAELFYDNLARYVQGEPLRNIVDMSGGY